MLAITIAIVIATLLCGAFNTTKLIGVAGVALLFYLHPLLFTAAAVLGVVIYFLIRYLKRRKHHANHRRLRNGSD